jgi:hypothetical protein
LRAIQYENLTRIVAQKSARKRSLVAKYSATEFLGVAQPSLISASITVPDDLVVLFLTAPFGNI